MVCERQNDELGLEENTKEWKTIYVSALSFFKKKTNPKLKIMKSKIHM